MGLAGAITAFVLLLFHAVGVLRLCGVVHNELESLFFIGGLVMSIVSLLGVFFNKRWGWPAVLCVLSLGLANAVLIYVWAGFSITLALLFGWTIFAMLIAFIAVDLWEPEWQPEPIEAYDTMHDNDAVVGEVSTSVGSDKKPVVKKSTRKKASKKKSSKKKSSKKKSTRKKSTRTR